MNWMQKISQDKILSSQFTIQTKKIGPVYVLIRCSFADYHRWYGYKHGPQGWNDSHYRDEEAHNRSIEMEPDCTLKISHQFSEAMPTIEIPERTPWDQQEIDAFDIIGDEMTNLENDNFSQVVKIKDVATTIEAWLFKPFISGDVNSRRVYQDEMDEVKSESSMDIFGGLEELFQQYSALS